MLSFGDGNVAGSLETTPKAARGCGIRRINFSSQSFKLRHQITWRLMMSAKSTAVKTKQWCLSFPEKIKTEGYMLFKNSVEYGGCEA